MSDEGGESPRVDLEAIRKNREALEPTNSQEQVRGEQIVAWLVNTNPNPEPSPGFLERTLKYIDDHLPSTSK